MLDSIASPGGEARRHIARLAGNSAIGCRERSKEHLVAARRWERGAIYLTVGTALASAFAGTSILANADGGALLTVAGVLALLAAGLQAAASALRPQEIVAGHKRGADGFAALRTQFNRLRYVAANDPDKTLEDMDAEFQALLRERDALAAEVPAVPEWAKRSVARGSPGEHDSVAQALSDALAA